MACDYIHVTINQIVEIFYIAEDKQILPYYKTCFVALLLGGMILFFSCGKWPFSSKVPFPIPSTLNGKAYARHHLLLTKAKVSRSSSDHIFSVSAT